MLRGLRQISLLLLLALCLRPSHAEAQLQTTANNNATTLAQTLVGAGVTIFNATLNCPNGASGTCNSNGSNIGLTSGVILASGDVSNAVGPNTQTGATTSYSAPGDPDLAAIIAPNASNDACVLEFDIIPNCDTIQIKYVFGSEEYPEWVNSSFNDVFAFFITGPGYPTATNIALVPGTTTQVSINNVNAGTYNCPNPPTGCTNCAYYVDNCGGATVEYDGFTTPLFAKAAVVPCSTYHVKLAVSDGGDWSLDSGVFLEASGTGCASPVITINSTTTNGSNLLVEGCNTSVLDFIRYGNVSQAFSIPLQFSGTGTNGVDATPAVPDTIYFAPGQDSVGLVLSAPDDGINEGLEYLYIVVNDTVCNNFFSDTAIVIISDPPQAWFNFVTTCNGQAVTFADSSWFPGGNVTNWDWYFGDGSTAMSGGQNVSHSYAAPGFYNVQLIINTDAGCPDSVTRTIQVLDPPTADFNFPDPCFGSAIQFNDASAANLGPIVAWDWSFGDGGTSNVQNPTHLYANPGTYNVQLIVFDSYGCSDTTVQQVTLTLLAVDAGADGEFCEGGSGAQLNAGPITGGVGPYYYTWYCDSTLGPCGLDSIHDNDPVALPNSSGWYYLEVQDSRGCVSLVDSVYVTVNPLPIANAGPDMSICADSAPGVILQGSFSGPPVTNYYWSPGAGLNDSTLLNPYARPDTTTIYTLVGFSVDGCMSDPLDTMATMTVHVMPVPLANGGPDRDICYGDTVMLQGVGSGSGPNYEYQWTPGNSLSDTTVANPLAFPTQTTEYVLVVYSNGCPSYGDTVRVEVNQLPTISQGWTEDICLGDTAFLDPTSSDPNATWQWWPQTGIVSQTPSGDLYVAPTSTTTYYMQATSSEGCKSNIDSVVVYLLPTPIPDAGLPQSVCAGDTIALAGSYGYTTTEPAPNPSLVYLNWHPGANLSDSTIADPWAWPTQSGWYYLDATYQTCTMTDSVFITVFPEIFATAEADTGVICGGDSVMLTAGGGTNPSYLWTPSAGLSDPTSGTPMAAPAVTTTYTVLVSENGCTDTASVTVDVIPTPDAAYLSSFDEGCVPFTVSFMQSSTNAQYYVWDFGDGSAPQNGSNVEHTFEVPGTYTVTMTAVNTGGCASQSSQVTITVADTAHADFKGLPGLPVTLALPNAGVDFIDLSRGAFGHHWNFGDGTMSEENNPSHNYVQPGSYMVTLEVTNAYGCVSTVTQGPVVVIAPDLFIPNVFTPNGGGENETFKVMYNGSQPFYMKLFDRWGNTLYETRNKEAGWDGIANGSAAPEGTYYYLITIGDKDYTGNFTLLR